MTTTDAITTRIQYNRLNRDFDCYVTIDGDEQYIGSAANYSDGERKCRDYAYDHYSDNHTPEVAAAIALGDVDLAAEASTEAPLLIEPIALCEICEEVADWQVRENGGVYTFVCEQHYQQEFNADEARDASWEAERITPPTEPSARCPGAFVPCGLPTPPDQAFCGFCQQKIDRLTAQLDPEPWSVVSARIRAGVMAAAAKLRSDPPVDDPGPPPWTCRNCGGAHHIQQCSELRRELGLAPVVRRVMAKVA